MTYSETITALRVHHREYVARYRDGDWTHETDPADFFGDDGHDWAFAPLADKVLVVEVYGNGNTGKIETIDIEDLRREVLHEKAAQADYRKGVALTNQERGL